MSSSAYPGAVVQLPSDNRSTGTDIFVVTWLFTGISAVVVVLKVWTRFKIIRQTGLDDAFTVLALAFLLAFASIITVSVHRGLGKHFINLSPAALTASVKLAIISNPLVFLAATFPNISVAISLDRILVPQLWQKVPQSLPSYGLCIFMILDLVSISLLPSTESSTGPCNAPISCGVWDVTDGRGIASIEAAFIIIAACIPSLRPFARALGRSLRLEQAKSLFIPKGYHHSHSRRHRAASLVPRESGSGTTAATRSRLRSGSIEDMENGTSVMTRQEKRQESSAAESTPPSTGETGKSMEKVAEEAMSHV
ncbi:MAG: hypothetical protein L6R41_005854 [Letrouitia leprolyta]|nr:MAG: hypothetical protein L6R41_005854 [Letrouitia leprolyta]